LFKELGGGGESSDPTLIKDGLLIHKRREGREGLHFRIRGGKGGGFGRNFSGKKSIKPRQCRKEKGAVQPFLQERKKRIKSQKEEVFNQVYPVLGDVKSLPSRMHFWGAVLYSREKKKSPRKSRYEQPMSGERGKNFSLRTDEETFIAN